jgi:hypothetical protein
MPRARLAANRKTAQQLSLPGGRDAFGEDMPSLAPSVTRVGDYPKGVDLLVSVPPLRNRLSSRLACTPGKVNRYTSPARQERITGQ